jgi:hypothetical protein
MLITVSKTSAPNASGVRDCDVDTKMRYPSPFSEPTQNGIDRILQYGGVDDRDRERDANDDCERKFDQRFV